MVGSSKPISDFPGMDQRPDQSSIDQETKQYPSVHESQPGRDGAPNRDPKSRNDGAPVECCWSQRTGGNHRVGTSIRRLEEARDRLNWPNVDLVRCAAWSESDEMKFSLAAHPGDHKIAIDGIEHDNDYRPENTYEETTTVGAKPLDQIVEKHGLDQVNYVEIMVNGAEMEVLRGATHMLRGFRPIRLLVKGHARTEQGQPLNQEISEFLDRHGLATVVTQGGDPAVG